MRRAALVLAAASALASFACSKKPDAAPSGAPAKDPASIVVSAARTDLVFTYVDAAGKFHDVTTIAEVPEASRAQVLVRDLSKSPDELQAAEFLYVADLRTPDEKGRFPCGAVSRRAFDRAGASEAAGKAAEQLAAEGGKVVTVYTTAWCGVCRTAKGFLRKKGVAFVERDVEKDPGAEEELAKKARAQGFVPQGVPVIDVAGELLTGFDARALDAALARHGFAAP